MSTVVKYGAGGGRDSDDTTKAKEFIIRFVKMIRTVINSVDMMIKVEHPVKCPPVYLNDPAKDYQIDIALLFPGFDKYNIGIEIDGKVGHNKPSKDQLRDQWIYTNYKIAILRLSLSWLKDWMKKQDYLAMFQELIYQYNNFALTKLPRHPLLYLGWKNRRELLS